MRIFAEPSGLFAALAQKDPNHQRARAILSPLIERGAEFHTHSDCLVNCASFVVMEQLQLRTAFAFDGHFGTEGFETIDDPEQIAG